MLTRHTFSKLFIE